MALNKHQTVRLREWHHWLRGRAGNVGDASPWEWGWPASTRERLDKGDIVYIPEYQKTYGTVGGCADQHYIHKGHVV
jgi:hypothetical protein